VFTWLTWSSSMIRNQSMVSLKHPTQALH
jgi:hypothetical protein